MAFFVDKTYTLLFLIPDKFMGVIKVFGKKLLKNKKKGGSYRFIKGYKVKYIKMMQEIFQT